MVSLWLSRPIVALQNITYRTRQIEVLNFILEFREFYLWTVVFNMKITDTTKSRFGDRTINTAATAMISNILFPVVPSTFGRLDP